MRYIFVKKEKLWMFSLLIILIVTTVPIAIAEEDEFEEDEREGFGIMERERQREHQDEGIPIDSEIGSIILYGTIAAIVASVGYTTYKMTISKESSQNHSN